MDTTVLILIIVVVVLVIAVVAIGIPFARRRRSEHLQEQFGPEYERSVSETGDRKTAEKGLRERQQHRSSLEIRELRPEEHDRFQNSWDSVQRDFVDDPTRALQRADELVTEVMRTRGYPVDDFDRRADDISVDHPDVVQHYREARATRDTSAGGTVDTEQQRHALTSYRSLVEPLLGSRPSGRAEEAGTNGQAPTATPPTSPTPGNGAPGNEPTATNAGSTRRDNP